MHPSSARYAPLALLFSLLGALAPGAAASTAQRDREVSAAVRAIDLPLLAPRPPQSSPCASPAGHA